MAEFTPKPRKSDAKSSGLTAVAVCPNEMQAAMLVAVLRDAGLEALAFDSAWLAVSAVQVAERDQPATGVPVCVPVEQVDAARQALAERASDASEIDWDTLDVGEEAPHPFSAATDGEHPRRRPIPATIAMILAAALLLAGLVGSIIAIFITV